MKIYFYFYFVTLLNGLVLIAALLFRKENKFPNLILSCLLATVLYSQGVIVFHINGHIETSSPLYGSIFLVRFLVPTLFYIYVLGLTVPGFKWSARLLIYFLPFFLSLVAFLILWGLWNKLGGIVPERAALLGRYIALVLMVIVTGVFLGGSYLLLIRFQKLIPQYFSNLMRVRLTWLRVIVVLFSIPWLLALADVLTGPFHEILDNAMVPVVTIAILIMAFFGLKQSSIFSGEEVWTGAVTPTQPESPAAPEKKDIKLLFFSPEELDRWKAKLVGFVEEQRSFLEPEYRLVDLAKGLGMKPYQVSEILNRGVGMPFFDFINGYRIAEAKKLLKDSATENLKILTIAMDCGFNSKSSFNDTFRKFTGMTPSQYRDSPAP